MGRIDRAAARRIVRKLVQSTADPDRFLEGLVGADERKLRVGDFRVLAVLDTMSRTILVERVDHRQRVYR
jgi:mRNA-degrading endonuclease RelE of RelBE toxin-antitoxin system